LASSAISARRASTSFAAYSDPHEFVGPAEVFLRVFYIHRIDEDARTGFLQEGQGRLLDQPGIELALP
jgi:hypothetical protein